MDIIQKLFENKDDKYAKFQIKLTPTIEPSSVIGVRVPIVRKLAKDYINDPESKLFIEKLPHYYYDENMLHGLLLSEIKNYDECIKQVDRFLPYVDNWAVCDIMSPKVFKKNKDKLIVEIKKWLSSDHEYTIRFGIEMLLSHYLDKDFKEEYLNLACVKSDKYYVNMMVAWFFSTALVKKWDCTIKYIEQERLDVWQHNKAIQKAIESYRITDEQKAYLRTLKK